MTVKEFWAESHLDIADGFGSMTGRKTPHRGLDVNGWAIGTPVPTYVAGVVDRVYTSLVLGNIVVLRTEFGWVGFCHLMSASVREGQSVPAGGIIGTLGNTGTATTGPHLHTTVSLVGNDPGGSPVVDPLPYVRRYRDGKPAPAPAPAASTWNFNPGAADWRRIQRALKARGRYSGAVDGIPGPNTYKGVQMSLRGVGYTGAIDGIPGPATCRFVQEYAKRFGGYTGPIDSQLGPNSWAGFALGLERP
ncbi:MAG TPA: peptidoglycan DD-metalloendopeptidase family protein [Sideroxyarcus sp.]|nr:peptidoglycan DD-metalloendopeptidase family protein [Sideroxyarcus sp.]